MEIAIFRRAIHRKIELITVDSVDNVDCFYVVHKSFDFSRVVELCRKKEIHNFYVQSARLLRILVGKCCQIM